MADVPAYDLQISSQPIENEEEILKETLREFAQMQVWRATFAAHWEEIAELVDPVSRNTFQYGNWNFPGQKKTDRQVDATAMAALIRFAAIMDSLLTPRNQQWHGLRAEDFDIRDRREVKLWFEGTVRTMFQHRYRPIANFSSQNQMQFMQLGAYGTGGMFVDQAVDANNNPLRALRYKQIPLGELFLRENHQGLIDGFVRWYRLTARQAWQKFGATGRFPEGLRSSLESGSMQQFDFLHRVCPRSDYDPSRIDTKGKQFASYHVCMVGPVLLGEGGYYTFPLAASRYTQIAGEVYGRSPVMSILPAIKTLNTEKRTFLKQGHRAGDPIILTSDDGLIDGVSLRPGAMNKGGMTSDGKPLVSVLPTGNIQTTKEMMDDERTLINDMLLVSLFQILTESPSMTATEVIERVNEKGILIAPTVGRQDSEYIGPMNVRELDLLARLGALEPMPPALASRIQSWPGGFETVSTNPLSRAARAQEASGFMRTLQVATEVAQATGDTSVYDPFKFDVAIPGIAEIQGAPLAWMEDDKAIAMKRQARAQQLARQQQIQAAPAAAAMLKAHVAAQSAGVDTSAMMGQGGQPQQPALGGGQ